LSFYEQEQSVVKNLASAQHIVVDLDVTLVNSDMLVENVFAFLRLHPLRVFALFFGCGEGRPILRSSWPRLLYLMRRDCLTTKRFLRG
jgi:hypothetical protein